MPPSSDFRRILSRRTLPISVLLLVHAQAQLAVSCYTHIFSFGDSLTDTGNYLRTIGRNPDPVRDPPYGRTYFGRPTGRFCDGRLIIDFIAEAFGLPFLPAYLAGRDPEDFLHGANFAVAGATALNDTVFESQGIPVTWTADSLSVQIGWFKDLLRNISHESDCSNLLSGSLFFVGEIGGNDYNHPFFAKRAVDHVRALVPGVIAAISAAVTELIQLGARTLVVPSNFPIGCVPCYLTLYPSNRTDDYDPQTGCLKWLNEFSEYHNKMLVKELEKLRKAHQHATIIYADYYGAAMNIFRSPEKLGFRSPLVACCGSGEGTYNYTSSKPCDTGSAICTDPWRHASWDGLHFTEATYKVVAAGVLEGPYADPPVAKTCPKIEHKAPGLYSSQCSG